jgi:hypothetical protein
VLRFPWTDRYRRMLQQERTPEAEGRLDNPTSLSHAAAEAPSAANPSRISWITPCLRRRQRGRQRPVNLMTMHNAKGPSPGGLHRRPRAAVPTPPMNSEELLEEERRCATSA